MVASEVRAPGDMRWDSVFLRSRCRALRGAVRASRRTNLGIRTVQPVTRVACEPFRFELRSFGMVRSKVQWHLTIRSSGPLR